MGVGMEQQPRYVRAHDWESNLWLLGMQTDALITEHTGQS